MNELGLKAMLCFIDNEPRCKELPLCVPALSVPATLGTPESAPPLVTDGMLSVSTAGGVSSH